MNDSVIYLITYDGQWDGRNMVGESPYTVTASSASQAIAMVEELEEQYPDRNYHITEKDVS